MLTIYNIEDDLEYLRMTKHKLEYYLKSTPKGNFRTNLVSKLITIQTELSKLEQRSAMQ